MIPPQAIEIEESVLGMMLLESEAAHLAIELLDSDQFYKSAHKTIFQTISGLLAEHEQPDMLSLEQTLRDTGKLDEIGGKKYIIDLIQSVSSTSKVEDYCKIIQEKALMRSIILHCSDIQKAAYDSSQDPYGVVDKFTAAASGLEGNAKPSHFLTPSQIFKREENKPQYEKLYTGNQTIDHSLCEHAGLTKGHVHLTIADSGHGKTAFALYMAEMLMQRGYKVAWVQLEGMDVETAEYYRDVCNEHRDNIYICQDLYEIEDLKRDLYKAKREFDIDYVVFDYVQNIEANKRNRSDQVEYISQQITRLAKKLNVVCHPLGQVTIDYGLRTNWKQEPRFGDVRWSQQLKQDAHIITSVFRPSRIETLAVNEDQIKDWNDNLQPFNSVYVKQAKVRYGKQLYKRMHLIHTDKGLKPYANEQRYAPEPIYS